MPEQEAQGQESVCLPTALGQTEEGEIGQCVPHLFLEQCISIPALI